MAYLEAPEIDYQSELKVHHTLLHMQFCLYNLTNRLHITFSRDTWNVMGELVKIISFDLTCFHREYTTRRDILKSAVATLDKLEAMIKETQNACEELDSVRESLTAIEKIWLGHYGEHDYEYPY